MKALKYMTEADPKGRLKLPRLRFKQGAKLEVIILEHDEEDSALLHATESSLAFWDNPIDDEIWDAA